jgi:hypothetical protein
MVRLNPHYLYRSAKRANVAELSAEKVKVALAPEMSPGLDSCERQ